MKDAFGGVLSIVLIAVFLVIVSGILGLVVNYSKAFRMKNFIITAIEQYDGAKGCFGNGTGSSKCESRIKEYATQLGYYPDASALNCPKGYSKALDLYCYYENTEERSYTIVTQVDINIPIINQIAGISIFQVHGDTRSVAFSNSIKK